MHLLKLKKNSLFAVYTLLLLISIFSINILTGNIVRAATKPTYSIEWTNNNPGVMPLTLTVSWAKSFETASGTTSGNKIQVTDYQASSMPNNENTIIYATIAEGSFNSNSECTIVLRVQKSTTDVKVITVNGYTDEFDKSSSCSQELATAMNATVTNQGSGTESQEQGPEGESEAVASTNEEEETESCTSNGEEMGWIMCPVAKLLDGSFGWLQAQIESLLAMDESRYKNPKLYESWKKLRNISYIILVPIMLVMVIGTALGFEIFSAYTIKKALPRMVVAVIFISLSWHITGILIDISNAFGSGIAGIIKTPFGISNFGDVFNPTAKQAAGQWVFIGAAATSIALSGPVLGIIISFIGTASLILLTVFIFLVARQMFIIALMLVSPLAILAWIFPGRDKLWSAWWSAFSKLLLIYPIIMAVMSVGLVFAYIIDPNSGGNQSATQTMQNIMTPLIKVAAFVIPYAMIPMLFKFVGGFIGNMAGMVNDKEKGMFDRLKNRRSNQYGQLKNDVRSGQFARNNTKGFGGFVSRNVQRASAPTSLIPGRMGSNGRAKLISATQGNASAKEAEKDLMENYPVDDRMWNEFAQHGHSAGDLRARVKQLRKLGDNELAAKLETMSPHAGNRSYGVAAMNAASRAGKMQDASAEALDKWYGNSSYDRDAKAKTAGDLAYNMKSAGNFVGTAIGVNEATGKVETYSSLVKNGQSAKANKKIFDKMAEAGPQAWGNMPGYEMVVGQDAAGNDIKMSAKEIALDAVTSADGDPHVKMAAIEKIASEAAPGAYTDPKTATFARKQLQKLKQDTSGDVALTLDSSGKTIAMPLVYGADNKSVKILDVGGGRGVKEGSPAYMAYVAERNASNSRMRPEEMNP